MYNYYPQTSPTYLETRVTGAAVWTIVSFILAIVGGLVVYFLFFKSDKKTSNKYLDWVKEFFNFKKMLIEDILKIVYVVLTIFITLVSFELITVNFIAFLLTLILGNLGLRIIFELSLIRIMIWKNTNEINKKLKG